MEKEKLRNVKTIQSHLFLHRTIYCHILRILIFFHPDYTVGFGVTPNHALRLVGYTTGREFDPALKIYFIQLLRLIYSFRGNLSRKFFDLSLKRQNKKRTKHLKSLVRFTFP